MLFQAVAPIPGDPGTAVAEEARGAALAFAGHRDGLAGPAARLLLAGDTRWRRRQAFAAMTARGTTPPASPGPATTTATRSSPRRPGPVHLNTRVRFR